MSKGYVYVLSNPAMPGIYKIGYSIHGGKGRADAFYKNDTGVAMPFELEFEIYCNDPRYVEGCVHHELREYRINKDREFFECQLARVVGTIMKHSAGHFDCAAGCSGEVVDVKQFAIDELGRHGLQPQQLESAVYAFMSYIDETYSNSSEKTLKNQASDLINLIPRPDLIHLHDKVTH